MPETAPIMELDAALHYLATAHTRPGPVTGFIIWSSANLITLSPERYAKAWEVVLRHLGRS